MAAPLPGPGWYTVRCVFALIAAEDVGATVYEERLTMWRAADVDGAIASAEAEALEYGQTLGLEYLGIAQAYAMFDDPAHGAEVFSMLRSSRLEPRPYVTAFFDTGSEFQGTV